MTFCAAFEDDATAIRSGYSVETGLAPSYQVEVGLRPPAAAGFAFEPQIKDETLNIDSGRRPVEMMGRKGPAVFARDDSGGASSTRSSCSIPRRRWQFLAVPDVIRKSAICVRRLLHECPDCYQAR
jgi:predicted ATPase